jgi:hypothetical protein
MPSQQALFFDHYDSLVDHVRQNARAEEKGNTYTLIEAAPAAPHEDAPARAWWLLGAPPSGGVRPREVVLGDGELVSGGLRWRELARRQGLRLLDVLGPREDLEAPLPTHVIFWCRAQEAFERLIADNLALGCDRLQFATLAQGERAWLLRAEQPGFFVLDAASADPQVEVFGPQQGTRLYAPLGTSYPLASLLIEDIHARSLIFFTGQGASARLIEAPDPQWQDVYQLTSFKLSELDSDEAWAADPQGARRFEIKLRLTPSHELREPSLWLLQGRDQERIERLLHAIPEPDLDTLQFTAQEDPQGQRFFLLRERHLGTGREYIDFEGTRLAPYAGYPNLFLPVDAELEPLLRKDRYRDLFALRPGRLTLLWRDPARALRLTHVTEAGFRPLTEMVDYLIGAGAEELTQIVARAVFDFQDYRHALAAPNEAKQERRARNAKDDADDDTDWQVKPADDAAATEEAEAPIEAPAPAPAAPQAPQAPLSRWEEEEIALETRLIADGQSAPAWVELARVKAALSKHEEAALCWTEALWLTQAHADAAPLERSLLDALERAPHINLTQATPQARAERLARAIDAAEPGAAWIWLWISHGARHLRAQPQASGAHQFLTRAHLLLEQRAEQLRKKERWLLWGQLIGLNRDAVAEARVREALIDELNDQGLRPNEIPDFIANRIYKSRLLDEQDEDTSQELRAAVAILEHIEDTLLRAQDEVVRRVSQAILAYGYERLGDRARSAERFEAAEQLYNDSSTLSNADRAWIALYLGATCELRDPGAGAGWLDIVERALRSNQEQGLHASELSTIRESLLQRAAAESPAAFLSPENFRSLFPDPQKYVRAQAIRAELEQLIHQGEFSRTLIELRRMAEQVSRKPDALGLQSREQAWLLGYIVSALHRIGHAAEGVEILQHFEAGAPDPATDMISGFYPLLYRIKLGEGLMDVGQEKRGIDLVSQSVRMAWAGQKQLPWLDHLDMLSAALQATESAPMEHRLTGVEQILDALFIDRPHPSNADSPQYRAIKLRLLDHCVEVGLSKERLSLRRYKHYLDEDEFHLRQRVVNERLTAP